MPETKYPKEYTKEQPAEIKDFLKPEFRYDTRGRLIMPLPGYAKWMLSTEPGSKRIGQGSEGPGGAGDTNPESLQTGYLTATTAIKCGPEGGWVVALQGGDADYPIQYGNEGTGELRFYIDKAGQVYCSALNILGGTGVANLDDAGALALLDQANLDTDVAEGTEYKRTKALAIDENGMVLLDKTVEGTYGRVLLTAITAGNILLSQTVQNADFRTVTDVEKALWDSSEGSISKGDTPPVDPDANDLWIDTSVTPNLLKRWTGTVWELCGVGNLDDLQEGITFKRTKSAAISASGMVLLDETIIGDIYSLVAKTDIQAGHIKLDTVIEGTYGLVLSTSIQSGKILLTAGGGVEGILPVINTEADITADSNFVNVTYPADISDLETQIDSKIISWFTDTDPSGTWEGTDLSHAGDMWWNTSTKKLKRYSGTAWSSDIEDQKAIDAYEDAAEAQDTADGKRRVFVAEPTTPYNIGDLWSQGPIGDLMKCKIERLTGSYQAADWEKASDADKTYDNTAKDIRNLPSEPPEGVAGLYATTDYLGYYDGSVWQVYINASGSGRFKGQLMATTLIAGSIFQLDSSTYTNVLEFWASGINAMLSVSRPNGKLYLNAPAGGSIAFSVGLNIKAYFNDQGCLFLPQGGLSLGSGNKISEIWNVLDYFDPNDINMQLFVTNVGTVTKTTGLIFNQPKDADGAVLAYSAAGAHLGATFNKWKDLYLSEIAYIGDLEIRGQSNTIWGAAGAGLGVILRVGNYDALEVQDTLPGAPSVNSVHLKPINNNQYYLGSSTKGWLRLYLTSGADARIYRGGTVALEFEAANLKCWQHFVTNATSLNLGSAGEYWNQVNANSFIIRGSGGEADFSAGKVKLPVGTDVF